MRETFPGNKQIKWDDWGGVEGKLLSHIYTIWKQPMCGVWLNICLFPAHSRFSYAKSICGFQNRKFLPRMFSPFGGQSVSRLSYLFQLLFSFFLVFCKQCFITSTRNVNMCYYCHQFIVWCNRIWSVSTSAKDKKSIRCVRKHFELYFVYWRLQNSGFSHYKLIIIIYNFRICIDNGGESEKFAPYRMITSRYSNEGYLQL